MKEMTPEEQAEVERLESEAAKHEQNARLLRASMSSKPSPDDFQQEERVQRELERAKDKRARANRIRFRE